MRKFRPILLAAALVGNLMAFDAVLFPMVAFSESLLPSCPADETALRTNCRGTRPYPDGGEYVGEFRDGKPNGQGTLTYQVPGENTSGNSVTAGPMDKEPIHIQMGEDTSANGVTAISMAEELARIQTGEKRSANGVMVISLAKAPSRIPRSEKNSASSAITNSSMNP